jgi:Protein of unknown function (DUF3054)
VYSIVTATSQPNSGTAALPAGATTARPALGRIVGLVIGDAISFLVFAAVGRETHHETSGLAAMAQVALTAAPFALGWFAVSPWLGAFRRSKTDTPKAMLRTTLIAWLAAWPATLLLRWAFTLQVPPVSFAIVILVANTLFLNLWRGAFAVIAGQVQTRMRTAR